MPSRAVRNSCAALATGFCLLAIAATRGGVIAHWSFDSNSITTDGNGHVLSAIDLSNTRDATTTSNGTAFIDSTNAAPFGQGITLHNTPGQQQTANNAYMSFANLTELMGPSGGSYSVAAWFKTATSSANSTILADWGNAPVNTRRFDYWFDVTQFGSVRGQSRSANAPPDPANVDIYGVNVGSGYFDDAWHQATWTWDKPTRTLVTYIDGQLALTHHPGPLMPGIDLMVSDSPVGAIGRKGDTNEYFVGSLDEIWVFKDQVLSPGNAYGLYRYNDPTFTPEPAAMALGLLAPVVLSCRRRQPTVRRRRADRPLSRRWRRCRRAERARLGGDNVPPSM
jgi:hypothetical protein